MSIGCDKCDKGQACCLNAVTNEKELKPATAYQADENEGKRAWARAFLHAALKQREQCRKEKSPVSGN